MVLAHGVFCVYLEQNTLVRATLSFNSCHEKVYNLPMSSCETTIKRFDQRSEKDSDYLEYTESVQKIFKEIPWIDQIENMYSELLLLYKGSDFVSGIALFRVCPEDIEITEKARGLFGNFIFASCLYTKPEYRNRGYGYELLTYAIDEVVNNGYKFIGIVDNDNHKLIDSYKGHFSVSIFPINSKISFIEFVK